MEFLQLRGNKQELLWLDAVFLRNILFCNICYILSSAGFSFLRQKTKKIIYEKGYFKN